MEETIVKEWLRSLNIHQYAESFIDNGYDDLEICKQIDAPDLDAIGVVNVTHRNKILQAVQILKVEGAASVYFTVEEAQAASQDTISQNSDPGPSQEKIKKSGTGSSASTPGDATNLFLGNADIDAYEAGRAELVRLPQLHLRKLIQDNLVKDNVNLTIHPYTTKDGERGTLEGLASRYADYFNTHFQDVLEHLEYLRSQEWSKLLASCKVKFSSQNHIYQRPDQLDPKSDVWSPRSSSSSSLDHIDDYPIYLPGKYNPSSCLSDAEEDQIYGFTGSQPSKALPITGPGYLNPRSQCIYELPPTRVRHGNHNGMKKKLGLGRLLKTLKRDLKRSSEPKNKPYINQTITTNPRLACDLSSTPLVVLPGYSSPTSSHCSQSTKSHSSGQSFIVTSASAPGTPGSSGPMRDSGLQEAIEMLKEQEIKRRREDQFREHEQMLQDIRHGLQLTKNAHKSVPTIYSPFPTQTGDTFMFDDDHLHRSRPMPKIPKPICYQHWYDEPPYESDPEDFLIGKESPSQVRLSRDEDVISLKTAGDISIPREQPSSDPLTYNARYYYQQRETNGPNGQEPTYNNISDLQNQATNYVKMDSKTNGCLEPTLLPHQEKSSSTVVEPMTLPLHGSSDSQNGISQQDLLVVSGGGPHHDVQSISSRLSSMSVEASRSESQSASRYGPNSGSDEARSATPSDYEDEIDSRDSESLVGRMRVLQRDMQKKILRLKTSKESGPNNSRVSNDDVLRERLEASYSCYQRQNSLPVKLKKAPNLDTRRQRVLPEETENVSSGNQIICKVRTIVDFKPSVFEKGALQFNKGELIEVLAKSGSGVWKGHLNGQIGYFKTILTEEVVDSRLRITSRPPKRYGITHNGGQHINSWLVRPGAFREILIKFNLTHLTQMFVSNGIEDIERFVQLCPEDLDQLNITNVDTRARIVSALSYVLEECEAEAAPSPSSASSFVRHVNGRVSLPPVGGSMPLRGAPPTSHQIYENFSYFRDDYSSSSTDTSSGYHSRPPTFPPHNPSPIIYATPSTAHALPICSSSDKDSYHAHVVQVETSSSPIEEISESTSC